MRTIQQDAIAEWHRQNDALADQLTREANRKKRRKAGMAKKKRRNPQDVTLRNIRAAKKVLARLTARIKELEALVKGRR